MSELKAFYLARYAGEFTMHEVYLKSEADKVIAELKAQKAQAEDDCAYWKMSEGNAVNATHETEEYAMQLYKELRHQKFKRCLAMAKWCEDKIDTIKNGYMVSSINTQHGVMTTCPPECNPKFSFNSRWHERWLELAEKFKEAK
jgi:hypothetical protein